MAHARASCHRLRLTWDGKLWPVLHTVHSLLYIFFFLGLYIPRPRSYPPAAGAAAMIAVYTDLLCVDSAADCARAPARTRAPCRVGARRSARAIPQPAAPDAWRYRRQTVEPRVRYTAQLLPPLARMRRAIHTRKIALTLASIRRKLRPLSTCTPHVCTSSSASS